MNEIQDGYQRILILDHRQRERGRIAKSLRRAGFEAEGVSRVDQMISHLQRMNYGALIVEPLTLDKNGRSSMEALESLAIYPFSRVIVVSNVTIAQHRPYLYGLGIQHVFEKWSPTREIVQAVECVVGIRNRFHLEPPYYYRQEACVSPKCRKKI